MQDFYHTLGVKVNASDAEIKAAYKTMAKLHHPDKNIGNPQSEELFKNISLAYQTLSDPWKRMSYDFKREHLHNPSPPMSPPPMHTKARRKIVPKFDSKLPLYITATFFLVMSVGGYYFFNFMNKVAAEDAFAEAFVLEQKESWASAYQKYTEALEFDNQYANAYYRRGLVCARFPMRRKAAIFNIKQAINYKPLQWEHYMALGKVYMAISSTELAVSYFDTCTTLAPKYDSAWFYKAEILAYSSNKYDQAIPIYQKTIKLNPKLASAHAGAAYCLFKKKSYKASISYWNEAIRLKPNEANWLHLRGITKLKLKLTDSACKDFVRGGNLNFKPALSDWNRYCR